MPSKKLIDSIKKELKRSAGSTMDATYLNLLKDDFESKRWNSNTIHKVREKYNA